MTRTALLVLEDGYFQIGVAYGAAGVVTGEIFWATAMTGYQELFTDPDRAGQILLLTAPHIGNTGVNTEDMHSGSYQIAGLVVREPARRASSWRATGELEPALAAGGVVGIAGVDTRALTRHLRAVGAPGAAGALRVGIFSGDALPGTALTGADSLARMVEIVRSGREA